MAERHIVTDEMLERAIAAWSKFEETARDPDPIVWNPYAKSMLRTAIEAAIAKLE